ncbi:RidA family protein [Paraliomyxa miuraensis]|uniref:RidA family protein n=1 Tax=Paraliomyxa miuraensis TaxID=376150 RepID=UPI00225C3EF4|nr:RidA family protein [Paraliomyxa miuraensis]MCX4242896.1 RidA family protein [Paraliomyxa miuraensis]
MSDDPRKSPRVIQPDGWPRPRGYSNGMAARGEVLAIAGQIGWDEREQPVSREFLPQWEQALRNVAAVLHAAGGHPSDLVSLTIYVTDKRQYLAAGPEIGRSYREILGKHFPTMALVQVADLLEDWALVEVQGLAVLASSPPPSPPASETDPTSP